MAAFVPSASSPSGGRYDWDMIAPVTSHGCVVGGSVPAPNHQIFRTKLKRAVRNVLGYFDEQSVLTASRDQRVIQV